MDGDRKCFRITGGVLVERTVKEVLPAVAHTLDGVRLISLTALSSFGLHYPHPTYLFCPPRFHLLVGLACIILLSS